MKPEIIKCMLLNREHPGQSPEFHLEYMDGESADEVDIGQEEWPYKYPGDKNRFTWKALNYTEDIEKEIEIIRGFQLAMNAIQLITELDIDFEPDITKDVDITKEFFNSKDDLDGVFDGRTGVLAQAYLFAEGSPFNGIQQYNDYSHDFTLLGWPIRVGNIVKATIPLVEVDMHEDLHTLGLRHDLVEEDALMWPYVKQGYKPNPVTGRWEINKAAFRYHARDITRVQYDYGASGIPEHKLNRWRDYRIVKYAPDTVPVVVE